MRASTFYPSKTTPVGGIDKRPGRYVLRETSRRSVRRRNCPLKRLSHHSYFIADPFFDMPKSIIQLAESLSKIPVHPVDLSA